MIWTYAYETVINWAKGVGEFCKNIDRTLRENIFNGLSGIKMIYEENFH